MAEPAVAAARARSAAAASAVSSVYACLGAVTGKDWEKADASGPVASLRRDPTIRCCARSKTCARCGSTTTTTFLDEEVPPRALEVPLTLRVRRDAGISEMKGWYRMRRKIDSEGWEITSASLQSTLD